MKYILSLLFFLSQTVGASPIQALGNHLGFGTFSGQTESGEKCSVEIDKLASGKVRIFLFTPRVNKFEFSEEDVFETSENSLRISAPTYYEDNAQITNTFVVNGKEVGIEREFCTYKCWTSMRPCLLY